MNLKEIKLKCMDLFYFYVDVDIASGLFKDYEISFAKLYTYDFNRLSEIEKTVLCFTIIIRFARSGMVLRQHSDIELETLKAIDYVEKSGLSELNPNDRNDFLEDLDEVKSYLEWADEKRKEKRSVIMDNSMYEIYRKYSEDENEEIFPPATAERIQNWERINNAVLPEEYKEFLLLSDGLRSYIFGGELFSLDDIETCPYVEIEEFLEESEELSGEKKYFIIGNYIGDGSMLLCDEDGNFYELDHCFRIKKSKLLNFLKFWYKHK